MAKNRQVGAADANEQLSELLSRIEAFDETLALAELRLEELAAERDSLASQLEASEQELTAARAQRASLEQSSDSGALAVVRLQARIEELERELAQAQRELLDYLPASADELVGADAGTLEHSPGRQQALVNRIGQLKEKAGPPDALAQRQGLIEDGLAWLVAPSGELARIGDADSRLELTARIESPHLMLIGAGGRGKAPAASLRTFTQSGWFAVRTPVPSAGQPLSSCSYLLQICGRHSDRYKHDDDFSFVWFEGTTEILGDAGPGRLDDRSRRYAGSTRAHNVATIDESLEDRPRANPFGSGLNQFGESRGLFFSECERRIGDISHARVLAFRPGAWVAVVDFFHDRSDTEHEYGQRFLLGPDLEPTETAGTFCAEIDDQRSVHAIPFFEATLAGLWRGQEEPELEGWSSSSGELVPAGAVKFAKTGSRELMATVFWLGKDRPEPDSELTRTNLSGRRIRLGWIGDGRRHQIDVVREKGLEVRYRAPSL